MKPNVYITRRIPREAIERLSSCCDVSIWDEEDKPVPRDVLERALGNADALFCLLTERIDRELIARAPKLKVISTMAVGYNNIDVEAAAERGIVITNTPEVLTEATADLTFGLLLATARRMIEASGYLRAGQWRTWSPMLLTGMDVHGATLGMIGMGRIGEAVARRAAGFGMKVLYYNRSRKPELEATRGLIYTELDTLLQTSDYVCIMTPYTPETANLIGAKELAMMKKTAILINTARGGIVDEKALYDALAGGGIWAAGLDVFDEEPISTGHPLLKLPNVVALPHIGSASIAARSKMADIAAENILRVLSGQDPLYRVNTF
ncbi:D-glycerate dehydrogenase [uncultured Paenibacillus sp.]|uniref:2-hydroxyacid dehydrogenase n=1 Tax=uncultured Paenibacillus sp. TaxID=227322 RepID=UPI0028D15589|nr:D-glycerate dehydrogenase [uncultured Paenibacillus sp.]